MLVKQCKLALLRKVEVLINLASLPKINSRMSQSGEASKEAYLQARRARRGAGPVKGTM